MGEKWGPWHKEGSRVGRIHASAMIRYLITAASYLRFTETQGSAEPCLPLGGCEPMTKAVEPTLGKESWKSK